MRAASAAAFAAALCLSTALSVPPEPLDDSVHFHVTWAGMGAALHDVRGRCGAEKGRPGQPPHASDAVPALSPALTGFVGT